MVIINPTHAQWFQISLTSLSLGLGWVHSPKITLVQNSCNTAVNIIGGSSLGFWTFFGGKPHIVPILADSNAGCATPPAPEWAWGFHLAKQEASAPASASRSVTQRCRGDGENCSRWLPHRGRCPSDLCPQDMSVLAIGVQKWVARGLTLMSTLGHPWLQPYCWVYHRPCPFSEPDSPAFPLVLETSREFVPAYPWLFWWFTHGQMTLKKGKWKWQYLGQHCQAVQATQIGAPLWLSA